MLGEYFHVRRLLWDEITLYIQPSEAYELRQAIGNQRIDENEELRQELSALVEILSDFQQQTDAIRDALIKRRDRVLPEPPGRAMLMEKLKLLARELQTKSGSHDKLRLQALKDQELLQYILSDKAENRSYTFDDEPILVTPRLDLLDHSRTPRDGILLRPGTSHSRPATANSQRPLTTSSQRPVSRGSTVSLSSSNASSVLETPELRQRLNVDEIDSIKDDVQDALRDEKLQLLEDIEFIQSCIDMEQELLDDDRRQVASARPPPSLLELQEFRKTLEKTLEDQEEMERVEVLLNKSESLTARRPSKLLPTVPPLPMLAPRPLPRKDEHWVSPIEECSTLARRVSKIRNVVQEARDEPFLT